MWGQWYFQFLSPGFWPFRVPKLCARTYEWLKTVINHLPYFPFWPAIRYDGIPAFYRSNDFAISPEPPFPRTASKLELHHASRTSRISLLNAWCCLSPRCWRSTCSLKPLFVWPGRIRAALPFKAASESREVWVCCWYSANYFLRFVSADPTLL